MNGYVIKEVVKNDDYGIVKARMATAGRPSDTAHRYVCRTQGGLELVNYVRA
jgi:hypothetical protein